MSSSSGNSLVFKNSGTLRNLVLKSESAYMINKSDIPG
ncbi:hypothetical protein T4A_7963 [Trichinella pseudospiralis]|uniref:Uncharacterized protein n=1 Tax=Trichinella pseudospiralis TaxID=6337 RepID=A0A0V1DQC8_TRIPS|nr:hypothetical protein T4A_7963 [Trichinella pseudospiralis]